MKDMFQGKSGKLPTNPGFVSHLTKILKANFFIKENFFRIVIQVIRNEWRKSEKAEEKSENLKRIKNYTDVQKNRLERLFENPEKPVYIPAKREPKLKDPEAVSLK